MANKNYFIVPITRAVYKIYPLYKLYQFVSLFKERVKYVKQLKRLMMIVVQRSAFIYLKRNYLLVY